MTRGNVLDIAAKEEEGKEGGGATEVDILPLWRDDLAFTINSSSSKAVSNLGLADNEPRGDGKGSGSNPDKSNLYFDDDDDADGKGKAEALAVRASSSHGVEATGLRSCPLRST